MTELDQTALEKAIEALGKSIENHCTAKQGAKATVLAYLSALKPETVTADDCVMDDAYDHVDKMIQRSDGYHGNAPWWHGWALRESFIAGYKFLKPECEHEYALYSQMSPRHCLKCIKPEGLSGAAVTCASPVSTGDEPNRETACAAALENPKPDIDIAELEIALEFPQRKGSPFKLYMAAKAYLALVGGRDAAQMD